MPLPGEGGWDTACAEGKGGWPWWLELREDGERLRSIREQIA